jgi:hypothetical protein
MPCCDKKKCQKACSKIIYYFNIAKASRANAVPDTYENPNGLSSYTQFGTGKFYSDKNYSNNTGRVEFTNTTIKEEGVTNAEVVADVTGYLKDRVSSVSFKYFFTSPSGVTPPGKYESIAYSSTGIFYNKKCYVTLTVLEDNVSYLLELVYCDNKKTCKEILYL